MIFLVDASVYVFRAYHSVLPQMHDRDGRTLLLNPQPQVKKVFEIVKAVPVAEVFASVTELDQYLDHMQRQITG